MNPRVSRSAALASKATGFPIAKIAARLAVGYALRRDRQRHHRRHPGELRADDRLRRRQVAAVRVREVPGRGQRAHDPHEVGRRGDGDRAHVRAGVRQGDAQPRARLPAEARRARPADADGDARDARVRSLRRDARGVSSRRDDRRRPGRHEHRPVVPARDRVARPRPRRAVRRPPLVQVGRHVRRRVRGPHALLLLGLGAPRGPRGPPRRPPERRDPRLGPQPHRPGDRVRLLLRARRDDGPRAGPRRGDDQLQPGDRLDRLRHLGPPVLRAADARGRARRDRGRAARGRDRPVRRPDPAEARRRARRRRREAARHERRRDRPRRGPRPLRRAARRSSATRRRRTRPPRPPTRRSTSRRASASRCSCARPTCSAAARWRSSTTSTGCATTSTRHAREDREIFLDRFLENAIEVDVDALCDGDRRLDRRHHAARRGGRHPLRRQRLRAAAALARRRDARADRGVDARHRAGRSASSG